MLSLPHMTVTTTTTNNPSAQPSRLMDPLPLEISMGIAQYLRGDRDSALALMKTCTALKTTGEIALHLRLDLSGMWDSSEPNPTNRFLDIADLRSRASIVDIKLEQILSSLDAHPEYIDYIEEIRLEPSDGPGKNQRGQNLFRLLAMISHRLLSLEILPYPAHMGWTDDERDELSAIILYDVLEREKIDFPRLTELRLGVQEVDGIAVPGWMEGLVALETLEYSAASGSYRTPVPQTISSVTLPNLRSISFDNLYDLPGNYGLDMLTDLLKASPNVATLRIRGQWAPSSSQPLMRTLAGLKNLRRIVAMDEDYGKDEVDLGIECQKLGKVVLGVEAMAVDLCGWQEHDELSCSTLPIPHFPLLAHLTLMTPPRPSLSEYAEISVRVDPLPLPTIRPHPWFIHHLQRAPLLHTILFLYHPNHVPSAYDHYFVEPELFVHPTRWTSEGHRGAVVRQWINRDSNETLWHIRILSRAAMTPQGTAYVGSRRVWRDQTWYDGRTVHRDVLERVYEAIGEPIDFLVGGRMLRLTTNAWELLREWKAGLEEGSEVGDAEYMALGEQDDDLLSESEG